MERTISGMMGKGSVSHNTRAFIAKNVDKERSRYNVEFCHLDIKKVYHELFDEALERYNAKQKRSDRKIDNYYEKIRQSKQEKLFHEAILQIGNKDDTNAKSKEGQLAKEILTEFMEDFQKRNPNLYVFSAHLHMDEETPHVHIDFVPFIRNSKRGLDTRVSLKGALSEQGFRGGTRSATEWNQWIESEKQELSKVAERYGVRWKQLDTHNKHLSVLDFEKQERAKEVAKLEKVVSNNKAELSHIIYQQVLAENEMEKIKQENEAVRQETTELSAANDLLREQTDGLMENREKLMSDNKALEQRQKRLQQDIEKMADSKAILERNIHAYDEDANWQLSEPIALMSAKAYREKNAMPLVERLKEIVKSLTIKCVNLMDQIKQLKAKVTKQAEDIDFYKSKVHQQYVKLEQLQENVDDFERVKQYVGVDKIDIIVTNARELDESHIVKNSRTERMEWADKKGRIDMMDNGNWSEQYSMENIMGCEYNMDNGYVEVYYSDGNILQLKCEEIEANLHTTEQSLAKLHKLLDDKPIEYVAMALLGELQTYCDIEADMVKGMFGTIVQSYLKQGYSKAMAEALAREFFRYES